MALREDYLLREDGDFPFDDNIVGGVILNTPYGYSDEQHKKDLIVYSIGSLKEFPTTGFGVMNYVNSEFNLSEVSKNLSATMASDKYSLNNGTLIPVQGSGFIINTTNITNNY